jgi:hypothetical protein
MSDHIGAKFGVLRFHHHFKELIVLFVKPVKAQFIRNPKVHEQCARQAC